MHVAKGAKSYNVVHGVLPSGISYYLGKSIVIAPDDYYLGILELAVIVKVYDAESLTDKVLTYMESNGLHPGAL